MGSVVLGQAVSLAALGGPVMLESWEVPPDLLVLLTSSGVKSYLPAVCPHVSLNTLSSQDNRREESQGEIRLLRPPGVS